jgi:hypothetical protein
MVADGVEVGSEVTVNVTGNMTPGPVDESQAAVQARINKTRANRGIPMVGVEG